MPNSTDTRSASFASRLREKLRSHRPTTKTTLQIGLPTVLLLLIAPITSDVTLFKIGLLLLFAVAAVGLHVLVNWAGELSLAHAGMVGLPALVVAKLSSDHNLSPLELAPIGILIGFALGAVVAATARRVSGLYVTIVTLAAGLAIDRFFFTKPWLVGTGNLKLTAPRLAGLEFGSIQAIYPIIVVVFIGSVFATRRLLDSKLGRALLTVRSDPTIAQAQGINVPAYRAAAYMFAGALAGLAGGFMPLWAQRVTPDSFPLELSFTYLAVVVVAGRGSINGVLGAALLIEGFRQFLSGTSFIAAYLGPVALIVTLTRFPGGLNQFGRMIGGQLAGVVGRFRPGRSPGDAEG